MAIAVVALALAAQLSSRPTPDVAWILYATRELLHGAQFGVDVVENSPPMIFGINLPVVALADRLGVSLWAAWAVAVTLLAVISGSAARAMLGRSRLGCRDHPALLAVVLAVLLLIPGGDFGQRDHLALILVVPYVTLMALRLEGVTPNTFGAALVGVVAALGVGIKPHFALLPLGFVAALWPSRGARGLVLAEHLWLATTGLAYVSLVALVTPEYYDYARQFGPLYQRFLPLDPLTLLLVGEGVIPPMVALVAAAALRPNLAGGVRPLTDALAVGTGVFLLAAVLQAKGWRYHFVPALSLGTLLAALLAWGSDRKALRVTPRLYVVMVGSVCALVGFGAVRDAVSRVWSPRAPHRDADPSFGQLLPLVRAVPPGEAVAVLSTNIASSFPLVLDGGSRWALRYPSLWPLAAFHDKEVGLGTLVRPNAAPLRPEPERRYAQAVVGDLIARRPALVLVLTPSPGLPSPDGGDRGPWPKGRVIGGEARRFDYVDYFSSVTGMARLLRDYRALGKVGMYLALWRTDLPSPDPALWQGTPGP